MKEEQRSLLLSSSSRFPPPPGVKLSYGTSGFRADAGVLRSTVYRVGILAALRALKLESVIGLMITASHNEVSDNGVKISDPNGWMLSQDWEPFADALANAPSPENLLRLVAEFAASEGIALDGAKPVEILVARDTRPSGESLLQAAKLVIFSTFTMSFYFFILYIYILFLRFSCSKGIESVIGAVASDMGILTTPQLHWMVRARNNGEKASESDYMERFSSSFRLVLPLG